MLCVACCVLNVLCCAWFVVHRRTSETLSSARQSRVRATALGLAAVWIKREMQGSQGMPGKVSVVEGSYRNDLMHDKDFSLSGGTEYYFFGCF